MTTTPRFKRGDRVRWTNAQGQPLGTVIVDSEAALGYAGGMATRIRLDTAVAWAGPRMSTDLWVSDELLEPEGGQDEKPTPTPRFNVGDRVRWTRAEDQPVGTVIEGSRPDRGYTGGWATLIHLPATPHAACGCVWLGDVALELVGREEQKR